jgi:beta-glucanase (GH16 family)
MSWQKTFSNDFTSSSGSQYLTNWVKQTGNGTAYGLPAGWGNNEAENYTGNAANVNVTSAGLNIIAIVNGSNITSARITSQNYFSQAYGLFQFTATIPSGNGLWPGLWMLPKSSSYGGWPTSGEIDIVETGAGGGATTYTAESGSLHSGSNPGSGHITQTKVYHPSGFDTRTSHTYDLLWLQGTNPSTPGTLQWFVDGALYETQSGGWYVPPGATDQTAPFDKPFYFLIDLAVGGNYTGGKIPANGSYIMTISDVEAFSLVTVPEPSTFVLILLGGFGFLAAKQRWMHAPWRKVVYQCSTP